MSANVLSIGTKFPEFVKIACVSTEIGKEFRTVSSRLLANEEGRWTVLFWWPKDFTFVCPTELQAFNNAFQEFEDRQTDLLGASTDSEYVHLAWRKADPQLENLHYPMIADTSKSLAEELGILEPKEKVAYRATFIIDPEGTTRWVSVYDLNVGRSVSEVLRVLDALQTGGLTACEWKPGEATIDT